MRRSFFAHAHRGFASRVPKASKVSPMSGRTTMHTEQVKREASQDENYHVLYRYTPSNSRRKALLAVSQLGVAVSIPIILPDDVNIPYVNVMCFVGIMASGMALGMQTFRAKRMVTEIKQVVRVVTLGVRVWHFVHAECAWDSRNHSAIDLG